MTKEQHREYDRRRHEEAKLAYAALMKFYPLSLDNLDGEVWKDIDSFEGYQVSNFGRVKSFKYKTPRILTPHLLVDYLGVAFYIDGKQKQRKIHILVAQAFIPNLDNKPEVNHDDGNKFNCFVGNLYWATTAENQQHAVKNGLAKSGVDDSQSKIKDEKDIIYIRENPDNLTLEQLATKFGMTVANVSKIQTGKRYPNASGTVRQAKPQKYTPRIPDEQREQIRADWATGLYSQRELARKYGCDPKTIRRIIREG